METTETSTQETQTADQSNPQIFDTQAQPVESDTPQVWMWGEELPGSGDKPEWFKDSKYKSVSEQAKAYSELEKRLGGFIGAPKEGYQLSEELGVSADDPSIQAVLEVFGKNNASNEFANELIAIYTQKQQELAQAQIAKEMELLGSNADYRINAIKEFASQALPTHLQDTFNGMVTSAAGIEVVEALMKKMQGSAVAPDESSVKTTKMDGTKLREMMFAKNEHGQLLASIDPEYKRKVDKAYKDYYGE